MIEDIQELEAKIEVVRKTIVEQLDGKEVDWLEVLKLLNWNMQENKPLTTKNILEKHNISKEME